MTPGVAQIMLDELRDNRLEVVLVLRDYEDANAIRVVTTKNPEWYQELCANFESSRTKPRRRKLPDTRIKRKGIERIL